MMVNTRNVSRFTGALPTSPMNADREIVGGPLYSPAEVLSLLNTRGVEGLKAWTKGCIEDLQKWELDLDDVLELVRLCLHGGQFLGAEWCIQKPGGPWAACDAYRVCRREWVKATFKEMDFEYYIKFAIGKTGQLLLLTSCHPSEDRW